MLRATIELAGGYNSTLFDMLSQDVDEVIMVMNYMLYLGAGAQKAEHKTAPARDDGFWDF